MPNDTIWIEKFKISSDLKADFEKSSSTDKSFLVWCLENGHVNENEYLSWASQEFQLPVVSAEFFANEEAKQKWHSTWATARSLHSWNPSLLPLDESASVIRVGCLEVPDLKLEKSVAYVLAPLSGMKSFWTETLPAVQEEPASIAPVLLDVAPIEEVAPISDVATLEDAVSIPNDLPPPPPQEFDANSLMANWGSDEEESEVQSEPLPEEEDLSAQMPEGFAMSEGFSASDIPIPTMIAPIAPPLSSPELAPLFSSEPAPLTSPEPIPLAPSIPPPLAATAVVVEQAAPSPTIIVKAKPPIPPMSPPTGRPAGDFIGMIELRNSKEKLDECQDLSEVAVNTFSKMSRYFDRHMILLLKGFELRPHIWAGNWNLRSNRPAGINLDQPSIFRVVSRTKLPYHGYTKPSACNDMFFGEWSNGTPPAHVTLVPIMIKDQLVGMILGATDGSLDLKVSLTDAERWISEITPHISRTKSLPPKAA